MADLDLLQTNSVKPFDVIVGSSPFITFDNSTGVDPQNSHWVKYKNHKIKDSTVEPVNINNNYRYYQASYWTNNKNLYINWNENGTAIRIGKHFYNIVPEGNIYPNQNPANLYKKAYLVCCCMKNSKTAVVVWNVNGWDEGGYGKNGIVIEWYELTLSSNPENDKAIRKYSVPYYFINTHVPNKYDYERFIFGQFNEKGDKLLYIDFFEEDTSFITHEYKNYYRFYKFTYTYNEEFDFYTIDAPVLLKQYVDDDLKFQYSFKTTYEFSDENLSYSGKNECTAGRRGTLGAIIGTSNSSFTMSNSFVLTNKTEISYPIPFFQVLGQWELISQRYDSNSTHKKEKICYLIQKKEYTGSFGIRTTVTENASYNYTIEVENSGYSDFVYLGSQTGSGTYSYIRNDALLPNSGVNCKDHLYLCSIDINTSEYTEQLLHTFEHKEEISLTINEYTEQQDLQVNLSNVVLSSFYSIPLSVPASIPYQSSSIINIAYFDDDSNVISNPYNYTNQPNEKRRLLKDSSERVKTGVVDITRFGIDTQFNFTHNPPYYSSLISGFSPLTYIEPFVYDYRANSMLTYVRTVKDHWVLDKNSITNASMQESIDLTVLKLNNSPTSIDEQHCTRANFIVDNAYYTAFKNGVGGVTSVSNDPLTVLHQGYFGVFDLRSFTDQKDTTDYSWFPLQGYGIFNFGYYTLKGSTFASFKDEYLVRVSQKFDEVKPISPLTYHNKTYMFKTIFNTSDYKYYFNLDTNDEHPNGVLPTEDFPKPITLAK